MFLNNRHANKNNIIFNYMEAKFICNWENYSVYIFCELENDNFANQFPSFVLANKHNQLRLSTHDETDNIIKFIRSNELIYNNHKELLDEFSVQYTVMKNIDEIRNFVFNDRNINELIIIKNKCIDYWLYLLSNETKQLWVINSTFYKLKLEEILNSILMLKNDDIFKEELSYLKETHECIKNKNKTLLIKILRDIKVIES